MMESIKETGRFVIGSGVTLAVTSLLKDNVRTPNGFMKKASLAIGIFALANYASGKVTKEFESGFDKFEENFDKLVSRIKGIKPEVEEA